MDKIRERLEQVIQTNAVKTDSATFLATHTPFQRLRFSGEGSSDSAATTYTEEAYFQQEVLHQRDKHAFQIILGSNGAGKSHLVRWLKERYVREIPNPQQEEILFISREESTLRGALEQIIRADLFAGNQEKTEELRKLISANEHLNDSELRTRISYEFAFATEHDDGTAEVQLEKKHRRNLEAFLLDKTTRALLEKPNGPIERIKMRLSHEETGKRVDEIAPQFEADDFLIETDWIRELQEDSNVSPRAFSLADALFQDDDLKLHAKLAAYLNQFLETVVQNYTNLRATDLKKVFEQLRRDLKQQGKNLTLFIEDITSFVGIDRALVEVLITDHKETDFCRLFSVVGITNDFYENHFPPNMKDRVTGRVLIDKASLFDEAAIAEMAARYLNAIYQDGGLFQTWIQNGGRDVELPIANAFAEHRWADHELPDGRVLTLFPFNRRALSNMYHYLPVCTPRMFLRNVLAFVLLRYATLAPANQFPPAVSEMGAQFEVPGWKDPLYNQRLSGAYPQQSKHMETLLRLWGDGTFLEQEEQGNKMVGALALDVFASFGLPKPHGIPVLSPGAGGNTKPGPDRGTGGGERFQPITGGASGGEELPIPLKPIPPVKPDPAPNKTEDPLQKRQKELEAWFQDRGPLASYRECVKLLFDALKSFIDWESHGISEQLVAFLEQGRIEIEGQSGQNKYADKLFFQRDQRLYYALVALSTWEIKGKRSWNFLEASDHLLNLYNWMHQVEPTVVRFVRAPKEVENVDAWQMGKWSLLFAFYQQVLSNHLSIEQQSAEDIYLALFQPLDQKVTVDETRSEHWRMLQSQLSKEQKYLGDHNQFLHGFFNRNQTQAGKSYYLDAATILAQLEELKATDWSLDGLPELDSKTVRDSNWYLSLRLLHLIRPLIQTAIDQETTQSKLFLQKVQTWLGDGEPKETSKTLFAEFKQFLTLMRNSHLSYEEQKFQPLTNDALKPHVLTDLVELLQRYEQVTTTEEVLLLHASDPAGQLIPYMKLLDEMEKLLDGHIQKQTDRLEQFQKQGSDEVVEQLRSQSKLLLADARNQLLKIHS